VLTMADLAVDPHVLARRSIVEVDGTPMQGLIARLSQTPGHIRWAGRPLGADTDEVLAELDARPGPVASPATPEQPEVPSTA
jgi:crotonobetainyl-CoA:carnitine CoA-transferase CaiB-like acyl-CoA transferase